MADERVRIVIEAQNRASSQLGDLQRQVSGLSQAAQGPAGLSFGFARIATGVGTATAAIEVFGRALTQALDYGAMGSALANIERSFGRFTLSAGQNADAVLSHMQRMSNGMLTQTDAMQQYNRAFLLMGEEMAAKMPQLIQVATAASAAGMGDFQYLLNSLVIGLGRTSPLILDNLGFTVKLSDAYEAYAQSVGKSASELSKAEQQTALLNAVMADAEKKFGDLNQASQTLAGAGITQLRTQMADLREEAARTASGPIDDVARALSGDLTRLGAGFGLDAVAGNARIINQMSEALDGYNRRVEEGASFWEKLTGQAPNLEMMQGEVLGLALGLDIVALSGEDLAAVMALLEKAAPGAAAEFRAMNAEAFKQRDALAELRGQSLMTADALVGMGGGARAAQIDMRGLNAAIGSAISLVGNLNSAARGAQGALQGMATDLRVSMMKAQDYARGIEKPQMDWFTTGKKAWEMPEAVAEYGRAMGTWLEGKGRDAWNAHNAGLTAATGGYSDLQSAMESYYDSWASQAAGILAPTQNVDLNALTEEVYGYQDKWDEAARRAMDVVKRGTESPWAAEMGLGGKEDALQYVRDFYAGRLPEDVNWESAIGQYQMQMEQMVGQQNLAAMFQEQLQSAGWGPENEAVMAALGAPMEAAGLEAAGTFATSFVGVDWKAQVGDPVGKFIADGVAKAFENSDPRFTGIVEGMVMRVIRNFLGGGGSTP